MDRRNNIAFLDANNPSEVECKLCVDISRSPTWTQQLENITNRCNLFASLAWKLSLCNFKSNRLRIRNVVLPAPRSHQRRTPLRAEKGTRCVVRNAIHLPNELIPKYRLGRCNSAVCLVPWPGFVSVQYCRYDTRRIQRPLTWLMTLVFFALRSKLPRAEG